MQSQNAKWQRQAQNLTFIGIDIGGTSCKIAILTKKDLKFPINPLKITVKHQSYQLFTYTANDVDQFHKFLQVLKKQLNQELKVCGTGGGTMLQSKVIGQLLGVQVLPLSEFDAHAKGLQFYKRAQLPISLECFLKKSQEQVIKTNEKSLLKQCKEVLFMSVGSGVNFQLYGQGQKEFQRQQAKDPKLTKTGDGYFLEGTSLGAGFLMGLGRLCTGQSDYSKILSKMREETQLKQYYEAFFINLLQMAINLSKIHDRKYLLMSGKLLSFEPQLSTYIVKAMKQTLGFSELELILVRLQYLQGFLGAIGAIQNILL